MAALTRIPDIAIVDYGMGNLFSVKHACEWAGLHGIITSSKEQVLNADAVILPGVGAFGDAMAVLRRLDLVRPLLDVAASGKPLLGICLGMQLLMSESNEFGQHKGLGLIEGEVVRFTQPIDPDGRLLKVPQIGWNRLKQTGHIRWDTTLLKGIPDEAYMYFVHSFYVKPERSDLVLSTTRYGQIEFCSSLSSGNISTFQGHPERSGPVGLLVYRNLANAIGKETYSQETRAV